MTMTMILRFSRRQLHTVVSKEFIKPSSPTPLHLKTYNLSLLDRISMDAFMPIVTFYPNTTNNYPSSQDKTLALKNSLSQTLTKYYPFAGRHAKTTPTNVNCNDQGAEFLESSIDGTLSDFLQNSKHEDLDQFFPYGLTWYKSNRKDHELQSDIVIPLAVQVTHFDCGGVAVATSLSHKIADGTSFVRFLNDWAILCSKKEKREVTPIEPHFMQYQNTNISFPGFPADISNDCVTRSFIFPNSKINVLKHKVIEMAEESGQPITKLTRVEVLTWLLYKCAVAAATKNNSGSFKPSSIGFVTNIRDKMMEPLPESIIGNFFTMLEVQTKNESEMKPVFLIGELKKKRKELQGLEDFETVFDGLIETSLAPDLEDRQREHVECYVCTSICRSPVYGIDFGWGKPIKVSVGGNALENRFIFLDAPNGDGIEALVCLRKQDMEIIQSDPELLEFC